VPKLQIHIDNFTVTPDQILVYTIIFGKNIDWNINRQEFEAWADDNELRDYEVNIPSNEDGLERDVMCTRSWADVYDSYSIAEDFLREYIQFLYEQDAMDIEKPIKKILSTHKTII
jgi:hypothetical protein